MASIAGEANWCWSRPCRLLKRVVRSEKREASFLCLGREAACINK
jgi:hypothetical protein